MMTEYDAMTEFGIDAVDCFAFFLKLFCGIKCGANVLWNFRLWSSAEVHLHFDFILCFVFCGAICGVICGDHR